MTMLSTVTTIFSSCPLLGLTATERWRAARSFTSGGTNTMTEQWFIIAGVVAICVLTVLFAIVTLKRICGEIKTSNRWFAEYARKRGLSAREQQIMLEIAKLMGIRRKESLFTLSFAFDKGAESLRRKNLHDVEKSQILKLELAFLRQKLGFGRMKVPPVQSKWATVKKTKLSSRQIPIGDKLYLTDNENYELVDVECKVIENDDAGLMLRLDEGTKAKIAGKLMVRYYCSAAVYEFDTRIVHHNEKIIALEHRNDMRMINRRRFVRVPLKRPALLAKFPFAPAVSQSATDTITTEQANQNDREVLRQSRDEEMIRPEFVTAVLTEIGGPGLRVEVPVELHVGDRILVIFKVEQKNRHSVDTVDYNDTPKSSKLKIVEDVGVVRSVRDVGGAFSIAIELTGLDESQVDQLVRVTNSVLLKNVTNDKNVSNSTRTTEETVKTTTTGGF